jgi:hypothetical protein
MHRGSLSSGAFYTTSAVAVQSASDRPTRVEQTAGTERERSKMPLQCSKQQGIIGITQKEYFYSSVT